MAKRRTNPWGDPLIHKLDAEIDALLLTLSKKRAQRQAQWRRRYTQSQRHNDPSYLKKARDSMRRLRRERKAKGRERSSVYSLAD